MKRGIEFRFTAGEKEHIREEADGKCQFPGSVCERPNTGIVSHITGRFEATLDRKDPEAISDPSMNAVMLCDLHEAHHDAQEHFQISCLLAERSNRETILFRSHKR